MAEDKRFQAGENRSLCANRCGFFGSPATLNFCSKCYRDHLLAQTLTLAPSSPTVPALVRSGPPPEDAGDGPILVRRCGACRRRVGLVGFTCRCGATFCGSHRYPEQHACGFDFKGVGREAIARANPVVKAEKLDKL